MDINVFLKLVLSLSNEGEDNLNSYLSFMWGFTLHISVRKIIAFTWPEKRGKKNAASPTSEPKEQKTKHAVVNLDFFEYWSQDFPTMKEIIMKSVTFCSSDVEHCARVVVPLLHVHSRKGKPGGITRTREGEIRRTRKGYCNSSEGQLSETMVCEKQLHDEITFIWQLTCSLMFFPFLYGELGKKTDTAS